MTIALGIDLGTTNTVAAFMKDGRPQIVLNAEGQRLTPSVVSFGREGEPLVGQLARRQATANPARTVLSIKRRMGSDHTVRVGARTYTPEEISARILSKVKMDTEGYLGTTVSQAIITVPAYFNDRQRQATKAAGALAGLDVIRIINEPTAAALAYGIDREDAHTVLVWDLGGGTFDVSILALGEGVFEVKSVSGDSWLGGDDYDQRLAEYLALEYQRRHGLAVAAEDLTSWQRLREAAEKAKIELSSSATTNVRCMLTASGEDPRRLELTLTREQFQGLTEELLQRMVIPTRQALSDAGLQPRDVDRVILVGGATRMPAVRNLSRKLFGKEPYTSVDPDEVVAMGAAIQAGVLLGMVEKACLLDVIPLSLGIETQGGLFARVITRNTPLPASAAQIFTTAADNQTSVDVHVLQGERELAIANVSLGTFHLDSIPSLPAGTPKIEVAFDVDMDGIVHVSATDLLSENAESIEVVSSKTLRPEEIEQMVREASMNADEDKLRRERIQAGIEADNLIGAVEKILEQVAGPGAEAKIAGMEKACLAAKEALASGDIDEIRDQSTALRALLQALDGDN